MARQAAPANPFQYGALALDESFTDRQDELAELSADIRNGQDVVLFAPRRYGKSSLMWRVVQRVVQRGVLVGQIDLMSTPTRERFAERLAKTIHDEMASRLFKAKERLAVFSGLRVTPTITVNPEDGSISFSFDARAARDDIDATLEELFALPGRIAAERGRRAALVFDEFQEVVEIDPALPKLMRSAFQEQPEVSHVYLGSKRHMMERIFSDANEPFWRSAKQMELGVIDPEAFKPWVAERFEDTGKKVTDGTLDRAFEITGGHPYATQELFYFLWGQTPSGGSAIAQRLEQALDAALRSENAHFGLLWDNLAASQRLVLMALADEQPGHPLTAEYQRRHSLPATPTVQTALGALTRAELVTRSGRGEYTIAEPFLAEWLKRR
ncbi:MAG TPA: ATP-binding protein [Thermoleophilaceae bacterium]